MTTHAAAPSTDLPELWTAFRTINERRRAVRDLDGAPIPPEAMRAILAEALLAPSSGNLQPYRLHWVAEPTLKARVAAACEGQRAAVSASALVVVVADPRYARSTVDDQLAHVEGSNALGGESKAYHRAHLKKFRRFVSLAPLCVWEPLRAVLSVLNPALTLLPLGPSGARSWAARSAIYAAQTLMLAAAAHGLDSCPMEGFSAPKVARLLAVPRGGVIPIVIALGHRTAEARIDPRWRRAPAKAVVEHL